MNLQEHIRRILKEETDKKQSILKIIEENGLYDFIKMSGLSLPEINEKVGELTRDILEKYIIDFVYNEGNRMPRNKNRKGLFLEVYAEPDLLLSFMISNGKTLWFDVTEYDESGEPEDMYVKSSKNFSDKVILDIIDEIVNENII